MDAQIQGVAPKIYYLHPLVAGPLDAWPGHFARIAGLGFNWVCLAPPFAPGETGDIFLTGNWEMLHPALGWREGAESGIRFIVEQAAAHGLRLMLDVQIDRVARDAAIRQQHPDWFSDGLAETTPDPRRSPRRFDAGYARLDQTEVADAIAGWWSQRLARLVTQGIAGIRCLAPARVPAAVWRRIVTEVRRADPTVLCLGWTPGVDRSAIAALSGVGFDRVAPSLPWWDRRAAWFVEEAESLRRVAPLIGSPEPSFVDRLAAHLPPEADPVRACRQALRLAAAIGNGVFVPMGFEYATRIAFDPSRARPEDFERARAEALGDLSDDFGEVAQLSDQLAELHVDGAIRALTPPGAATTSFLRADTVDVRDARVAAVVVVNPATHGTTPPLSEDALPPQAGAAFGEPTPLDSSSAPSAPLGPEEVRVLAYRRLGNVEAPALPAAPDAAEMMRTRVAIEAVTPSVPDDDFPVKWIAGAALTVGADVFADGHDMLAANLLWRAADETEWHRVTMHPTGNDRWEATFTPMRVGAHEYSVEAWWDVWASFRHDLHLKRQANQALGLEIQEARGLIESARKHAAGEVATDLDRLLERLQQGDDAAKVGLLLAPETLALMQAADRKPFLATLPAPRRLHVDRPQAGFASWYELFPRSVTGDPARHGTFRDVIARLPAIRDMGFDVLYFPPINPIGRKNRKGRNNSLTPGPQDVGSPYAIGSEDGGHDAVHPQLGTLEDFRALLAAARDHGMEIALDFAIQCSPDHPWLKQHPDWFRYRPDGSIRYAENPPKKYEDIVNPDFYADASMPSLWIALRDVILFWIEQGVRTFRVDNPHTKPLPFWRWMIGSVQARHPDVLFLSEAFTRPKVMYRLAKVGFSQSYTYFTWRNTKQELTDYLTELNRPPARDCFRPNFFVNTPDINPVYLQTSGRPGFLIRAALATTLSGLWGMYSGFEICEAAPLPGREEYLDSEKYEIRVRNFEAPGNIVAEITALNRIRRAHPALQTHLGVTFYAADNDQVILYGKQRPGDREIILVAVSLDPHTPQESAIEVPLWQLGLPDDASVTVRDLMTDTRFTWHGKWQRLRLDPARLPFTILQVTPAGAGA
ncbi:MAG: hypothetical protein BGO51_21805 [Rhodospirillales bacterium 69-11]|nr:MAG: hypothetical protein BGO51_21805 [Rhodospirillales bacterium 69-11]